MYDRNSFILSESPLKRDLLKLFKNDEPITILDIGGCEGEDSVRYSKLFPKSSIFVFEPLSQNKKIILENFERYNVKNAELLNIALSDVKGQQDFYVSSGHPSDKKNDEVWDFGNKSSSLLPPGRVNEIVPWLKFENTISVTTETLENFINDRKIASVDFVHMDVQGAELKVLAGAGKSIKKIKAIWLEVSDLPLYKDQPLRNDVQKFMKENGFYRVKKQENDEMYLNSYWYKTISFFFLKMHFKKNLIAV
ncbi:MAG: noeI [Ferruginibacter sp.]|uniref:FkbM family methyltransferase n=1 Tax=Ferruginibacter sp. TaxID=1940288 RepID=UPI002658F1E9|nr:FkbM family methyltransferase [Ferruginibacter sp.]MDB5280360.1 noeI [Ferruginibacter sp.]